MAPISAQELHSSWEVIKVTSTMEPLGPGKLVIARQESWSLSYLAANRSRYQYQYCDIIRAANLIKFFILPRIRFHSTSTSLASLTKHYLDKHLISEAPSLICKIFRECLAVFVAGGLSRDKKFLTTLFFSSLQTFLSSLSRHPWSQPETFGIINSEVVRSDLVLLVIDNLKLAGSSLNDFLCDK